MKTILYFENEDCSSIYNDLTLRQIRQLYQEDLLVVISAGEFTADGELLRPSCRERSEEYVRNGADLVLSLPTASVLGGYGKKEFAGAALVQRLRTEALLILPCSPVPGQTAKECGSVLREYAMQMFLAGPDYRRKLTENLAAGLPFREAQRKAVCTCIPDAGELLSSPVNRQALWLLDAMLQLYYMADVQFIPAPACSRREDQSPACSGHEDPVKSADPFERAAALKISALLDAASEEQLIDIAGSTTQMVADLFAKKEQIRAAGSLSEITQFLLPESPDRSRLFLLKAILGVRKIYMQICSLHVYVPYCYVTAKRQTKTALLQQLEASSWVPFWEAPVQGQNDSNDYFYLLRIDKQAEDLIH